MKQKLAIIQDGQIIEEINLKGSCTLSIIVQKGQARFIETTTRRDVERVDYDKLIRQNRAPKGDFT